MAEKLYAPKQEVSDDRIKTASISEATFTDKAYAESPVYLAADAGVKEGARFLTMQEAASAHKIEEEVADKSLNNLEEFDKEEYEKRKLEAAALETTGADDTAKATGEIIKEISEEKEEQKEKSEAKVKIYYLNYRDIFTRAFKLALISRDMSVGKEVEKELDRRKAVAGTLRENLATKFSKTVSWGDVLRKATEASAKELAAPVEKDPAFKYEGK